jgi:integrase
MPIPQPTSRPFIRERASGPFWYAKWSREGEQVMRALGRAWAEPDGDGGWRRRRGKPAEGALTEAQASARMLELVKEHHVGQARLEEDAEERRRRGITFRELAREWLVHLERERGAKPSTLVDYGWMVAEPGQPHRRGTGRSPGILMTALGDRPVAELTTREVGEFLRELDARGCKPRTVNRYRQLISAAFNYATREDTYGLALNPAANSTKRREPPPAVLDFYEPDEVEKLARAAELGAHRTARPERTGEEELAARRREDSQDADLYRIAAYTGLRLGELLALRWEDANLDLRRLVVHRALSAGIEGPTKGWQARFVPLSDGAADALTRLHERPEFTGATDYVFCNRFGRALDGAVLRRRFKRTAAAAGLRVLRFHGLRHGAGSLVARQADARWVQGFLGHSKITTTERYLHAKARPDDVDRLNRAFAIAEISPRRSAASPAAQNASDGSRASRAEPSPAGFASRRSPVRSRLAPLH